MKIDRHLFSELHGTISHTIFLTGILLILLQNTAFCQRVFTTKYRSQADVNLYETQYRSEADIIVNKSVYSSQADAGKGMWYEVKYRSQADWAVYWTMYRSEADCVVFFAKYRSEARRNDCFLEGIRK